MNIEKYSSPLVLEHMFSTCGLTWPTTQPLPMLLSTAQLFELRATWCDGDWFKHAHSAPEYTVSQCRAASQVATCIRL